MKRLLAVAMALALAGCAAPAATSGQESHPAPSSSVRSVPNAAQPTPARVRFVPRVPTSLHMWKFVAPVVPIALRAGVLVPPPDPHVLGWWGQKAGSSHGTILLTGHTVHTGGGTLDDLALTPVGSIALVSGVKYKVVSVRIISKPALAKQAQQLFAQDGPPKLVVVTCNGYNWATHVYANNTVVTALPI